MKRIATRPAAFSKRRAARRERGFTLVELLMATTAGLMVSAAAFLLAKNASTAFQEETRITAAQLSASLGLQRLASDIGRAGFLTTPNITTDPLVCNESGSWPAVIANLRAVSIEEQGSLIDHAAELTQSIQNGFYPDRITLAGSFDTAEVFPVRTIQPGGTGPIIYLETSNLQMARTCRDCGLAGCQTTLEQIFKADRIVRILTPSGHQIYGLIAGMTMSANEVAIKLQAAPTVPRVALNPNGYEGDCNYCQVSVISVVRYEIQSLVGNTHYGPLVAPVSVVATADDGRTELTRAEIGKDGLPISDSLELVAELAVDLRFGISFIDPTSMAVTDVPPPLPDNPLIYTTKPERIRSVHVRFSTRARAPDRDTDTPPWPGAPIGQAGADSRKYRFKLPVAGNTKYARMRTLYSEVALQNLVRATW